MSERFELNEEALDDVVGGAFHYNTQSDGSMTCRIDGVPGTYKCTSNAKNQISIYILNNRSCTLNDIINYALANGYFWE